ncbi:pollen Ole e 1 allergen and extensin family protein, partial [Striga asiatica]
ERRPRKPASEGETAGKVDTFTGEERFGGARIKITKLLRFLQQPLTGPHGYAMLTGTMICAQCKDGQVFLFDYLLNGIKVTMTCPGSDEQLTMSREETTN